MCNKKITKKEPAPVSEVYSEIAQRIRYYLKHQNYSFDWKELTDFQKGVQVTCENLEELVLDVGRTDG